MIKNEKYITHDFIVETLLLSGYKNSRGFCLGFAMLSAIENALGELDAMTQRLDLMQTLALYDDPKIKVSNKDRVAKYREQVKNLENELLDLSIDMTTSIKLRKKLNDNRVLLNFFEKASLKFLPAQLINELTKVNQTISSLKNDPEELKKFLDAHTVILSIAPFFDGLAAYTTPTLYPELSNEGFGQSNVTNLAQIKTIIGPDRLEDDITFSSKFCASYTQNELSRGLECLVSALEAEKMDAPISIVIGGGEHAISVGYNPKSRKWSLHDINKLPIKHYENTSVLAKDMISSISQNDVMVSVYSFKKC